MQSNINNSDAASPDALISSTLISSKVISSKVISSAMKSRCVAIALVALFAVAAPASAETLLIKRVQQENPAALPDRGLSMSQVEARYGAPTGRLDPRGGQKSQWPTIHRWTYPAFTVYFENDRVIDAVANKSTPAEIGPKPPIL